jgi:acetyl esterase
MYPTQLDEIRSVIRWLNREGSSAGLAARPLAVCGDSAGGNMSAVIARESSPNSIALAVLINPVVDMTLTTVKDPELRGFSEMMVNAYVPKYTDPSDPSLSPLLSKVPHSHPPTFIAIGDTDPWRAEQDLYAEKLKVAGVKLEVFRAPTGHLGPDGAAASPIAIPTLTAAAMAIKAAFGG